MVADMLQEDMGHDIEDNRMEDLRMVDLHPGKVVPHQDTEDPHQDTEDLHQDIAALRRGEEVTRLEAEDPLFTWYRFTCHQEVEAGVDLAVPRQEAADSRLTECRSTCRRVGSDTAARRRVVTAGTGRRWWCRSTRRRPGVTPLRRLQVTPLRRRCP